MKFETVINFYANLMELNDVEIGFRLLPLSRDTFTANRGRLDCTHEHTKPIKHFKKIVFYLRSNDLWCQMDCVEHKICVIDLLSYELQCRSDLISNV